MKFLHDFFHNTISQVIIFFLCVIVLSYIGTRVYIRYKFSQEIKKIQNESPFPFPFRYSFGFSLSNQIFPNKLPDNFDISYYVKKASDPDFIMERDVSTDVNLSSNDFVYFGGGINRTETGNIIIMFKKDFKNQIFFFLNDGRVFYPSIFILSKYLKDEIVKFPNDIKQKLSQEDFLHYQKIIEIMSKY